MNHTMQQFQDRVKAGRPCELLRDLAQNFREVRISRDSSAVPVLHHVYRQNGRYVVEHACDREGCPTFHGWEIPEPGRFYRNSHVELFLRAGIDPITVRLGEDPNNTGARDSDSYEYWVGMAQYVVIESFRSRNTSPVTQLFKVDTGLTPVADDRPLAERSKIRRRIEDRLRKGTDAEILKVARSLGVSTTP